MPAKQPIPLLRAVLTVKNGIVDLWHEPATSDSKTTG